MANAASILIADDEEVFRETAAELLRLRGYRCDCVAEAQTALAALEDQHFDLLIADIRMPGNGGLQLIEEVQQDHPGLPVILVTGAPSLDSAIHSVHLPVAAYLTKPLDLDSFYGHVDRCVAQSTICTVLHDARQVFLECAERIEAIEMEVSGGVQTPTAKEIGANVNGAVRAMLDALKSLEPLWSRYVSDEQGEIQALATSPHEIALQEAVDYAVLVLERTRKSFKSKELGDLRVRLTRLQRKGPGA